MAEVERNLSPITTLQVSAHIIYLVDRNLTVVLKILWEVSSVIRLFLTYTCFSTDVSVFPLRKIENVIGVFRSYSEINYHRGECPLLTREGNGLVCHCIFNSSF